jgi:hypothetical protein
MILAKLEVTPLMMVDSVLPVEVDTLELMMLVV